jgi:excinuclease ABC subunit A
MEKAATRAQEPASIEITGAREHNLDVPRLSVPKNRLVVFTGPSGSGKSSLAFDTLYAERQRRYVESLSAYARQFLGQLERPSVERLQGLSPTIAIEQKSTSGNPRSTVGTITEIYDYMRVLWARVGVQHCPSCGKVVQAQTAERICEQILAMPAGAKATVVAPLILQRAAGHVPLVPWPGRERGARSGADHPGSIADDPGRGHRPLGLGHGARGGLDLPHHRHDGAGLRCRP